MKYVAYVRVSTEKQGRSGLGLESQKAIIRNYVSESDIAVWFEESRSGKDLDVLPQLSLAVKYVMEHDCHVLVIAKTDRLRNTQQALDLVDELTPEKVFFCNIGRNADKFLLTIFFAFAEKERTEISIRTKAALAVLKARGVKLGRPCRVEKGRECFLVKLRENAKKGAAARKRLAVECFGNCMAYAVSKVLRERGMTFEAIAVAINGSGHLTPCGKPWIASSVYRNHKRFAGLPNPDSNVPDSV